MFRTISFSNDRILLHEKKVRIICNTERDSPGISIMHNWGLSAVLIVVFPDHSKKEGKDQE